MTKKRSGGTREKLLTAAGDVFMEKGFHNATVAEICNRAGANIASVNYYFGSKEALYQETWRHFFAASIKLHPLDGGVSADAPAEERLRGQVKALIERIADARSKDFCISLMEVVNPSGLLREVMMSELNPLRNQTMALMRQLLGPEAPDQLVAFCEVSIISMCIHPILLQRACLRATDAGNLAAIDDLEAFVDHVVKFALAGIAATRDLSQ